MKVLSIPIIYSSLVAQSFEKSSRLRVVRLELCMNNDVFVKPGIIIPDHELEITASRAGGAGGQHVNKTDSRITVRWNVPSSSVLSDEQKKRVMENLQARLTTDGDLIIHNCEMRSQQQNKQLALEQLASEVLKALFVPKKRMKTRVSRSVKESRLQAKKNRSSIKQLRGKSGLNE